MSAIDIQLAKLATKVSLSVQDHTYSLSKTLEGLRTHDCTRIVLSYFTTITSFDFNIAISVVTGPLT